MNLHAGDISELQNSSLSSYRISSCLIFEFTHAETFTGRVLSDVMIEAETAELWRDGVFEGGRVETVKKRRLIGSSPPSCERRCSSSCGRCQAVQVPVVSQQQRPRWISRLFAADATPRIAYSRGGGGGDGVSNYKPMAWKCKCGDLLFNP